MHPEFNLISQPFSNTINIGGIEYLYFSGTAYLGIPQNEDFIKLYIEGIKKFGLNNGTSRTNNIQLGIYDEAEKAAAKRFKSEDALITSSGYLAAQLTVKALSGLGKVLYAPTTHPALWLENQPLNSKSFPEWKVEITELINHSAEQNWVLVSNSMNNLFPEIYDFSFLEQVNPSKKISLIVDDSHGIGVNNNGLGSFDNLPKKENINCVVVASMAKALGLDAGLVLGSREIIRKLKRTNTFIGASPPAAAGLYAFINGAKIYNKAWNILQENIQLLSTKLKIERKFEQGFPVFQINKSSLADRLLESKILISSFPYPDVNGEAINRIILSSWHTEEDISRLIATIG
ncbi:aminotransferase class I/II-fold pyridoxal phosphate-dependent enzyme [Pedobacter rhodius]|uniref:Aminotransferase class I/II-fold pyridoxal phosphate-dependent enzyme n=1 Tax=Pedobacter rhodius TaxID=3004098 RepID=A0ABT4KYZ5_9SPHI|nr:aminotransferase class I/II-fold pyridoxal phosphate-dependent enzyme [Pedobacter sp. SJ11]MCZ4224151.1 aminotransferase class I/II-fold pyridoxal phosphate-dependent enzyme [Pedobacter sp. SJ11]